jgi:hypothetical protein
MIPEVPRSAVEILTLSNNSEVFFIAHREEITEFFA